MEVFLPEFYLASALITLAVTHILVRAGSAEYTAMTASFVVGVGNVALLGAYGLWTEPLRGISLRALLFFLGSGLFGYTLSRTCLNMSFARIGVTRSTALHATAPLFSTATAILFLQERPGPAALAGTVGVVAGVLIMHGRGEAGGGRRLDLLLPLAAAVCSSFSMVFRKSGMLLIDAPALGSAIACSLSLPILMAGMRYAPRLGRFRCSPQGWRFLAGAAIVNSLTQFFLMRSLVVFGVAHTVPIYSTSPVLVLLLTALFLRRIERVTIRLAWAVVLTVIGATLITASRYGLLP